MDSQDVTNLLTLGLGAATVWLGFETRRVAIATKESVELQSLPYLALSGLEATVGTRINLVTGLEDRAVRLGLRLSNPGQVLINYEVESIEVVFADAVAQNPQFETRGGVIHPKAETIFYYPWIFAAVPLRPGLNGEVRFRINFWSSLLRVNHVASRLRYTLQGNDLSRIEWLYLDGPSYA